MRRYQSSKNGEERDMAANGESVISMWQQWPAKKTKLAFRRAAAGGNQRHGENRQ
jgi:hypothetical protein